MSETKIPIGQGTLFFREVPSEGFEWHEVANPVLAGGGDVTPLEIQNENIEVQNSQLFIYDEGLNQVTEVTDATNGTYAELYLKGWRVKWDELGLAKECYRLGIVDRGSNFFNRYFIPGGDFQTKTDLAYWDQSNVNPNYTVDVASNALRVDWNLGGPVPTPFVLPHVNKLKTGTDYVIGYQVNVESGGNAFLKVGDELIDIAGTASGVIANTGQGDALEIQITAAATSGTVIINYITGSFQNQDAPDWISKLYRYGEAPRAKKITSAWLNRGVGLNYEQLGLELSNRIVGEITRTKYGGDREGAYEFGGGQYTAYAKSEPENEFKSETTNLDTADFLEKAQLGDEIYIEGRRIYITDKGVAPGATGTNPSLYQPVLGFVYTDELSYKRNVTAAGANVLNAGPEEWLEDPQGNPVIDPEGNPIEG